MDLNQIIENSNKKRIEGKEKWGNMDNNLCMLCGAYGNDKRSLFIRCMYAIDEMIPEALDIDDVKGKEGFYLLICKCCRGRLLGHLREWREECVELFDKPKDHDGYVDEDNPEAMIPIRENGVVRMITKVEWDKTNK